MHHVCVMPVSEWMHSLLRQLYSCCHWSVAVAGSHFMFFCSCDLDHDTMTFIYEPDLYPVRMYRMNKSGLRTSRLLKVIVWLTDIQTHIHTHIHTDRHIYIHTGTDRHTYIQHWNYIPCHFVGGQQTTLQRWMCVLPQTCVQSCRTRLHVPSSRHAALGLVTC